MSTPDKREALLARAAAEDALPLESLTPEQLKRKRDRDKQRKGRSNRRQEKAASVAASEQEWWESNRSTLQPQELEAMIEQDYYLCDVLVSMDTVQDVLNLDPDLVEIVEDLVKAHGTTRLGNIMHNQDIPASWMEGPYWRNPALLAQLESEGPQTAQFVQTGLLCALPDWRVVDFLHKKVKWEWDKAATLVGWREGSDSVWFAI